MLTFAVSFNITFRCTLMCTHCAHICANKVLYPLCTDQIFHPPPHLSRLTMDFNTQHLLWGVTLYSLHLLLCSIGMTLTRVSSLLLPSQAYAISIIGELISFLPFLGVTKREWKVNKCYEWIAFSVFGFSYALYFAAFIYCSQTMPLGNWLLGFAEVFEFAPEQGSKQKNMRTFAQLRKCI